MASRRPQRSSVVDLVDHAGAAVGLSWGRSVIGCDACGTRDRPAGFELKVDGRLVERLCSGCAGAGTVPELLERARARAAGSAA